MRMNLQTILKMVSDKTEMFSFDELFQKTKIKKEVLWVIISRLEEKGFIRRIEKGKYLIVPLTAGKDYTLHEFVIGSVLVNPYAIAYWSALNYHGFTEQIAEKVFIQTTSWKEKQQLKTLGVTYQFVRVKEEKFFGAKKIWIEETQVNITDKEKTIIDCLDKPQYCGGIIEVAKAINLHKKEVDFNKLAEYAKKMGNSGVVRRLGYLCDLFEIKIKLGRPDIRNYLLLDPTMPEEMTKNSKWRLIINLSEKNLKEL